MKMDTYKPAERFLHYLKDFTFKPEGMPEPVRVGSADCRLSRSTIHRVRDSLIAKPAHADNFAKRVRAMYNWGQDRIARLEGFPNPANGIKPIAGPSAGHTPWTESDIAQYLAYWGPGTVQRLTVLMAYHLAARRGDLVRMGDDNVQVIDGERWVVWTQEKTGAVAYAPIPEELDEELALHPSGPTWLLRVDKRRRPTSSQNPEVVSHPALLKPFPKNKISVDLAVWREAAGLPDGLTLHGIRAGAATQAYEMGAGDDGVGAILGHAVGSNASRAYLRTVRQKRLVKNVATLRRGS